jgi:flagellar motor switch protein FliN/FliY
LPAIPASPPRDLSALGKVWLRVSAVLGGVDMTIDELLKLGRGAVLELDRRVGEMIDIQVNYRIVAKGEIVVVEDRIAVALKELLDAAD